MLNINEQSKTEQSILCPTNPYAATKAGAAAGKAGAKAAMGPVGWALLAVDLISLTLDLQIRAYL